MYFHFEVSLSCALFLGEGWCRAPTTPPSSPQGSPCVALLAPPPFSGELKPLYCLELHSCLVTIALPCLHPQTSSTPNTQLSYDTVPKGRLLTCGLDKKGKTHLSGYHQPFHQLGKVIPSPASCVWHCCSPSAQWYPGVCPFPFSAPIVFRAQGFHSFTATFATQYLITSAGEGEGKRRRGFIH